MFTFNEDATKILVLDAANARQEGRLEVSTAELWDGIYAEATATGTKRAAAIRAVLEAIGEWKDTAQKDEDGKRTAFGNVVQRFGARFDAAKKRATGETKVTDWLKLVQQAASNAHVKGEHSEDAIVRAVQEALAGM